MRNTLKAVRALAGIVSTTVPIGAYAAGSWETAVIPCLGLDQLLLLLDFTGAAPDGTSIELKSLVQDFASPANFYSELTNAGALDEVSIAVGTITGEGNRVSVPFDCSRFDFVKFQAKQTGGAVGDLALSAIGG